MSWLDVLLLLPLVVGLIRGLMRGLIVEVVALAAVLLGCLGAKLWGVAFAAWLLTMFSWPETVCHVVAYALLFLGIAVVLAILAKLLTRLFHAIHLGFINRLLGALVGVLKWGIIVLFVVIILHLLDTKFDLLPDSLRQSSVVYQQFVSWSDMLVAALTEKMQ